MNKPDLMRILLLLTLLLFGIRSFSQNSQIIRLVFSNKSNFDVTISPKTARPRVFYLTNITEEWRPERFHMDKDLTSDSVRNELINDEHSPYNHTYIFKDSSMNKLFSAAEKQNLHRQSMAIKPGKLISKSDQFQLISSFKSAPNGFFFSVTDPIFTADKQYAFIDVSVLKKDKETEGLGDAYIGGTLLIYQNIKGKGWTRIHKKDHLIN